MDGDAGRGPGGSGDGTPALPDLERIELAGAPADAPGLTNGRGTTFTLAEFTEQDDDELGWHWKKGTPLPPFELSLEALVRPFASMQADADFVLELLDCCIEDLADCEFVRLVDAGELDFPACAKQLSLLAHHLQGLGSNARIAGLRYPALILEQGVKALLAKETATPGRISSPDVVREVLALATELTARIRVIQNWHREHAAAAKTGQV